MLPGGRLGEHVTQRRGVLGGEHLRPGFGQPRGQQSAQVADVAVHHGRDEGADSPRDVPHRGLGPRAPIGAADGEHRYPVEWPGDRVQPGTPTVAQSVEHHVECRPQRHGGRGVAPGPLQPVHHVHPARAHPGQPRGQYRVLGDERTGHAVVRRGVPGRGHGDVEPFSHRPRRPFLTGAYLAGAWPQPRPTTRSVTSGQFAASSTPRPSTTVRTPGRSVAVSVR